MSWDIFAMDFPREIEKVSEIPSDFEPPIIGDRAKVIAKILEVAPTANFSDPSRGVLEAESFSMEISLGDEGPIRGATFFVRGGDEAAHVVEAILERLRIRAIDTGTGEFFAPGPGAVDGLRQWGAYCRQVLTRCP